MATSCIHIPIFLESVLCAFLLGHDCLLVFSCQRTPLTNFYNTSVLASLQESRFPKIVSENQRGRGGNSFSPDPFFFPDRKKSAEVLPNPNPQKIVWQN